ncbi:PREDICTED: uncharacterized protein LOC109464178 [Branchiostoma belcheri]|uniref:Uncharacterized protein LOC109464178 n=1 Tax=Branchiostoma belcheri TaxID=7741 RepID=A0A6P4Y2P3_BRABE|nr:PREDICTED: uncharacterized protein LOC109464178 [Branchiostoma belcheri]
MVAKWLLHLAVLVCYSETVVSISRQEGILQDISIRSTSGNPRCYIRIEMNPKEVESAVQQLSHHQKSPADFIHFPPDEKVTINKPATIILLYGNVAVLDVESQKNVLWYCRDATQYLVIDEGK